MSRQSGVLRRLITVSAVALGAGLVVTACSPVKLGSAAIVGNERITIATLDTEVTNLSQTVKLYPSTVQLSQEQQTQQTLTWLIRFEINDELARQAGITVSTAEAQKALDEIYAAAKSSAQAQGIKNVTLDLILVANGIPPNLANEVGRYQAIDNKFAEQVNGGQEPTSTSAQSATTAKLNKARCLAAKVLKVQVNPQFGRLDYSQVAVVAAPGIVARPAGPAKAAFDVGADAGLLIVLVTSPRVAPGLLSWAAWEALRSASAVLVPAGHPLLPALDEAGIGYRWPRSDMARAARRGRRWSGCPRRAPSRQASRSRPARGCCAARPTCPARTCSTWWRPWTGCVPSARGISGRRTRSLAPHLLEEPYEALEALESGDAQALCEELGDVLLQVAFHARIAAERARWHRVHHRRRGRRDRGQADPAAPARVRGRDGIRGRGRHSQLGRDQRAEERKGSRPNGPACPLRARWLRPRLTPCRSASRPCRWPPSCSAGRRAPGCRTGWRTSTAIPAPMAPAQRSAATCSAWC